MEPARIGYRIAQVSGFSRDDCHVLVWRYDARFGPDGRSCESWIVQVDGWRPRIVLAGGGLVGALWRAPSGLVYATDGTDVVRVYDHDDPPGTPRWQRIRLAGALEGIWGVGDACLWAWGRDERGATLLFQWDGARWSALPAPGRILSLHGTGLHDLWAVGADGLASRWDGTAWKAPQGKPIEGALWDVFAAEPEHVWVCGPRAGLYHLGESGWRPVQTGAWRPACVARWNDTVWVGARDDGLLRVDGDALVAVDPAIEAERFDARVSLLVTTPRAVLQASTWDGGRSTDDRPGVPAFQVTSLRAFVGLGRDSPPKWEMLPPEDDAIDPDRIPDVDW